MIHTNTRVLAVLAVCLGVAQACDDPWEHRECTADESRFIDVAIDRATTVEAAVQRDMEARFGDGVFDYAEVVEELRDVRERGDLRCGVPEVPLHGAEAIGLANRNHGTITLNVEGYYWTEGFEAWLAAEYIGELEAGELSETIQASSLTGYWLLQSAAYHETYGPAVVAGSLVHEAAHLATNQGHGGEFAEIALDESQTDYMYEVEDATRRAIYWELWMPGKTSMAQVYASSRD